MAEVIVDEDDKARLIELRKKHKNILRNIWNPFDKNYLPLLILIRVLNLGKRYLVKLNIKMVQAKQ